VQNAIVNTNSLQEIQEMLLLKIIMGKFSQKLIKPTMLRIDLCVPKPTANQNSARNAKLFLSIWL
jgi:hypothetical protein